jgi:putative MATE family efflux protein
MANDFSKGPVWKCIVTQAIPLTMAQMVHLLYNIVDRIYIGHLPETGSMALTGVGLTFPVVTLIAAFTCLFGMGGTPLFSIARGAKEDDEAERIMGNVFALLVISSVLLCGICYLFRRPILFLFGASEASYVYADEYLRIYLYGTIFAMITTGMNGFINAQGFPKVGMMTTILGAVMNLILDPVFIFGFGMGVGGAALATVISQCVSAIWVLCFLTGKETVFSHQKAFLTLKRSNLKIDRKLTRQIMGLGAAGFFMQGTNCLVQVVCNATLQNWGGDLYVGVMTILNSVREILTLPVMGITNGSQPVLGYNYGAKQFDRVRKALYMTIGCGVTISTLGFLACQLFPEGIAAMFVDSAKGGDEGLMIAAASQAMRNIVIMFPLVGFQIVAAAFFQYIGHAKLAIFVSMTRQMLFLLPLLWIIPRFYGAMGVWVSMPIADCASITLATILLIRELKRLK